MAILSLNEVRPGRPEQFAGVTAAVRERILVSMKSGLEGRNNFAKFVHHTVHDDESQ